MNVQDEIQRLGTQKGYTNISGLYYTMNEDVVINVLDLDNDNSGTVFGYDGANGYQNPTELKGNRVGAVNTAEGYLLTQQRTYTEGDTVNVDVRLAGMYNEQYEQTAFTDGADIACKSTYRMYYANEKYVFRIQNTDGTYSLLDKNGNLTGVYSDIYQEKGRIPNNRRHTSEAYISGVNRNAAGAYTTDLYNAQGNKIISDYQGYADIDGTKDYLLVYTRKSIEDDYKAYMICDHNGNVLMTNEQYGLYDFFETDDGALLACVYNTDADGNKKFGAVKLHVEDTPQPDGRNGLVFDADGVWRYYVNDAVDYSYAGLAANEYGWWKITNGTVDFTYTGLAYNDYGWWYMTNGVIDYSYTGMAANEYGWWYVRNGMIDFGYTGMALNEYGWWYITNGALDLTYTGMALNEYGWWYMTNGALDLAYTGMAANEYGWWYMTNGVLDFTYTGMAANEYGWWYMTNGVLDFTYTGMALNEYGWWYMTNGALDWNYTGLALNEYGWWYIRNGALDLTYNGPADNQYGTWNVVNGHVEV